MSWADRITRTLMSESAYASMMHEELPDWLDIETPPTPPPRPTPKKETPKVPPLKTDFHEKERALVREALHKSGRTATKVSQEIYGTTVLNKWLKSGYGLGPATMPKVVRWAEDVLDPDLAEERRNEEVAAEMEAWTAEGVTAPDPERDTSGLIVDEAPSLPDDWHDGVAKIEATAREIVEQAEQAEEPAFDPKPYPETILPKGTIYLTRPEPPVPPTPPRFPRNLTPADVCLAHLAETLWTYEAEKRGLRLPEGYRWVVGVERVQA